MSEELSGTETTETDWYAQDVATFGDRLQAAREHVSMSQALLAKRIGVKKITYCAWEQDQSEPRANKLQMLSGLLGVSMRWLLTGEGQDLGAPDVKPEAQSKLEILAEIRDVRMQLKVASDQLARLEKVLRLEDS
ncbi:helix-turn-helix transcriptional regulator [Cognatishimia sp. WU-CL00825]|uniref:helix-turn-helix domain-containing protein n=1 Tax=Cognatishimia sp. WU-CL00825 TaxID=3127658 RepID=UPI0031098B1D